MTEKEKMLAGMLYDPASPELAALRETAHDICRRYNALAETDAERSALMRALLPKSDEHVYIQGPMQFDYGVFTEMGEGTYVNFNFTCLDCAEVKIGKNVFIGPNVSLLTPVHPLRYTERNVRIQPDGSHVCLEYAKPIVIGDNCWIAGNVTICGGVTIGSGCVIGAGSVVTRDIPDNMLAVGVPCRPLREIDESDSMM